MPISNRRSASGSKFDPRDWLAPMLAGKRPISSRTPKTIAVRRLGSRVGLHEVDPWGNETPELLRVAEEKLGRLSNSAFEFREAPELEGVEERVLFRAAQRERAAVEHRNDVPKPFLKPLGRTMPVELRLLTVADGFVAHIADAPIIVTGDRHHIVRDYSSKYARLVYFYDHALSRQLDIAAQIDATVLVIGGDDRSANYCHWMADTLARLACLRDRPDRDHVHIVTPQLTSQFQRDSLRKCGVDEERIHELGAYQSVRARELLVPSDIHRSLHPCLKGAPWAMQFLRDCFLPPGESEPSSLHDSKLYISRMDADRRRVRNETELVRELRGADYTPVTLSGMTLQQQVSLFSKASHVIGLHGAGLANIIFSNPGTSLIELFPRSYGTPAFYLLAESGGIRYASYVGDRIGRGRRPQMDDLIVDVSAFVSRCSDIL